MRGGEKVFEVLCELYPHADVFTLFYEPDKVSPLIRSMHIHESKLAHTFPLLKRHYRYLLPLMPTMAERLPVQGYDLAISTSHCVAKGIMPIPADTPHICYCFTPMRYVWDKYDDYFGDRRKLSSRVMPYFRKSLQEWDIESSARVSHFLTSSQYVRSRIREHYEREAQVIPAPVDWKKFSRVERSPEDFYLVVSALEPYKRVDIAIEAFNTLKLPLKIAGSGSMEKKLRERAGEHIEFLGWVPDRALVSLYSRAKALVFPSDEDFGIVPLEAAAVGCPVIALERGGALETVISGKTGAFFAEQTANCLASCIEQTNLLDFDPEVLREHARQFDRPQFKERLHEAISRLSNAPAPLSSMSRPRD
jgi:glycosyltransferase involved in cell wall biosynthesis